jgi:hypothetical protein
LFVLVGKIVTCLNSVSINYQTIGWHLCQVIIFFDSSTFSKKYFLCFKVNSFSQNVFYFIFEWQRGFLLGSLSLSMDGWLNWKCICKTELFNIFISRRQKEEGGRGREKEKETSFLEEKNVDLLSEWLSSLTWILNINEILKNGTMYLFRSSILRILNQVFERKNILTGNSNCIKKANL